MGTKSKRRCDRKPRPQRPYLRRVERIKLVACLDYSLAHHVDLTSVATANLDSLKEYERHVAEKGISSALKKEYREYGREDGDFSLKAFLAEGSAFMRYKEHDLEVLRLESSRLQRNLRKRNTPKSLPQTSTTRTRTSRTLSLRPSVRSDSTRIVIRSTPESSSSVGPLARQTLETATTGPLLRPRYENERPSKTRASASATASPARPTRRVKREPCPERVMEIAETASPPSPSGNVQSGRLQTVEAELALKSEELQSALRRITEKQDYVITLSNRLHTVEKEYKEMERSINKAAEHRQDLTMQETLRIECLNLRSQNIKMTSQRKVISMAAEGSLGPSSQNIRDDFELILAGLKDACSSLDIMIPAIASDVSPAVAEAAAELWSQRLTGSSLHQLGSRVSADEMTDIQFLSALAATGIAELVFESNFPDFLARESPLLDQYREHILLKAGPQTLSELDLLAYYSLLSAAGDEFDSYSHSHFFTDTARSLSSTIVSALAHLISPHTDIASDTFVEPILRALKLKANLVLTRKRYTLVFPQPGDRFGPTTMIRDGESHRRVPPPGRSAIGARMKKGQRLPSRAVNGGEEGRARVKLCLFPGLYVEAKRDENEDGGGTFRGKQSGVGFHVRNVLVECENFEKNTGRGLGEVEEVRDEEIEEVHTGEDRTRRRVPEGYVPLVRAVVLV
ncbi:hypothetical protein QBC34DRAFT_363502 [Podospora aff. communis PSN243]|uniref:Uncharacterized protein n=1 Tax=Podospora aff. communis PSN243 TaxID=3040156 RepID=A0AAV9G2Y4_9PEZI|nr:hypothetical protein QBC34DRAFT_363502 [Podospora aff. communis PSN243]